MDWVCQFRGQRCSWLWCPLTSRLEIVISCQPGCRIQTKRTICSPSVIQWTSLRVMGRGHILESTHIFPSLTMPLLSLPSPLLTLHPRILPTRNSSPSVLQSIPAVLYSVLSQKQNYHSPSRSSAELKPPSTRTLQHYRAVGFYYICNKWQTKRQYLY